MYRDITTKIKQISYVDPILIFNGLHHKKWSILLDSALHHPHYGRFSYIAVDPFKVLWVKDGRIMLDDLLITSHQNPFALLKSLLAEMPQAHHPDLPPFQGGLAGAFAYDLYQYMENIPAHAVDNNHFPDMAVGFYDVVIAFDAHQKKAWIISTGWPEKTQNARRLRATARLAYFTDLVQQCTDANVTLVPVMPIQAQPISSNFQIETYIAAVNRVIAYIFAGDIFEANISQCFIGHLPKGLSPFNLYQRLRERNPAPFAAFMNLGDISVASASPERFMQLQDGFVETRPIKGTRPRGATPELDRQLAEALKVSRKDYAENIMIVDLLRNDLSKVCCDHSVEVAQLCGLETYATVHHLVSVIKGKLKPGMTAVDLLLATFPGGSITGAPKIRAMEIIAEIEPTKRGIYCGSLGFIGFNGTMDSSIAIRTYTIKDDVVTFQAGGAVVADSNPHDEYQETLSKSSALHVALGRTS